MAQHIRIALVCFAVLFAALAGTKSLFADQPQGPGNVTGIITDGSDKPLSGLALKLVSNQPASMDRSGKHKSTGDNPPTQLLAEQTVGSATTDAQGKFTFSNIPSGAYILKGGSKSIGFIYADVIVKPKETTDVGKIQVVKM